MDSISLVYGLPALYVLALGLALTFRKYVWGISQGGALVALVVSTAAMIGALLPFKIPHLQADPLGLVMQPLVAFLGWIIIRFSQRYLEGEAGAERYLAALLCTFAFVSILVLTRNLGVLALAWTASSLSLHHLLTFHRDRAQAQIVAHKKFLASRMAEVCLLVALFLIYRGIGTLDMGAIVAYVQQAETLSASFHVAAILIALSAILKSAQLPVHGWLIQVMEAPTPISALQHAGVVNIGGFILIRFAALISAAPVAQTLLVVVGSLTAVLAGLVMMTRISIKVRLAWSTCAQMGFMLMECGLGMYGLALLHLVAHSLYKAHAFLATGDTVTTVRQHDLSPATSSATPTRRLVYRLLMLPIALILVTASAALWSATLPHFMVPAVALGIVGVALAPLLGEASSGLGALARGIGRVLVLTQIYLLWHLAFSGIIPEFGAPPLPLSIWVGACFGGLYLMQNYLLAYPRGFLASRLFPWAYAGFFLDERFTRLTFRIWPARMSPTPSASLTSFPNKKGGRV